MFFCSVNEPYYVKYEKLDILTKIINSNNNDSILNELKIYLSEADPDFVKKTIKAIG